MAQLKVPVVAGTAATTAAVQLVPARAIKKFLAAQSITLAATAPASPKPPVVRVICVRK